MAFQDYFSVVAFFIFLRETLEASVIIAVLLQSMNRTAPRLKKQGEQTAVAAVAIAVSTLFILQFYSNELRYVSGDS